MSPIPRPPFAELQMPFAELQVLLAELQVLVHAVDEHATQRWPLVAQAASALEAASELTLHERQLLADRLERWRYQLLQRGPAHLGAKGQRLVEALDQLSAALWNGAAPSPRDTRRWIVPEQQRAALDWAVDAATPLAEVIAQARWQTQRMFLAANSISTADSIEDGQRWRMGLYAPLYLSSYCINHCHYCHFRYPNDLPREHLTLDETLAQAEYLAGRGFRHLLLVAGDFPKLTSTSYFVEAVRALAARGFELAIEIAPRSTLEYQQLAAAGVQGVTLYQETYQEDAYAKCHDRGTKAWFDWRLEGLERAAVAGIGQVGMGILLGLAPALADLRALAGHADYLLARFPNIKLAFSLPRLSDAPAPFVPPCPVDDDLLVRFYCALRLSFPRADLVLSTRERPELRNRLANICITRLSAESCTTPGGYGMPDVNAGSRGQFPVHDQRTLAETAQWLTQSGFQVSYENHNVQT